ncbi:MAG: 23S rRNA (guanosine(2251)-2'-O)-methyltransferase RlmB [Mycoplasma sp.]|nr:23S rRNA (guanosine(2251)-2'-O)-methyltransferase RlmB [Mycoplasma sp.]
MSKFICGKNSVVDAIKNNFKITKIFSIKPLNFDSKNIEIEIVDKNFLDKLTSLNHQGIVAIIDDNYSYYDFGRTIKDKPNIILILDHIEDVHNLGAILRTANAAGIKHIVIPDKRCAQINDAVLKISSGGFIDLKVSKVPSLQPIIEKLKRNNYWIYTTALNEKSIDYSIVNYNFPLALVVGNEAKGVSKTIINASDQLIKIPMYGTVQSLNVSVSTGIFLFEIIKKIE